MSLNKKYFFRILPLVLAIVIIVLILFWPFKLLTENSSKKINFSANNHLQKAIDVELKPDLGKNILVFGGDIMLSRTVNAKMEKYKDYNWPFLKIAPLFNEADLAVANLESPFLFTNNYQVLTGSFSFKANPKSAVSLTAAGFDVLSLANNHILNQGKIGLRDTYQVLAETGISYIGLREHNLVIRESRGVKFAFLAYTYDKSELIANIFDENIAADIASAKQQADVVIVLMHAGTEYTLKPNKVQIDFAHLAVDSGADLVVGTHPHWPQTIEKYQGKTIIYSLGNLVFDQMWSKETSQGLVVKVYFDGKELSNIEYIPISIKDYGQAIIMPDGAEKSKLLQNIGVE